MVRRLAAIRETSGGVSEISPGRMRARNGGTVLGMLRGAQGSQEYCVFVRLLAIWVPGYVPTEEGEKGYTHPGSIPPPFALFFRRGDHISQNNDIISPPFAQFYVGELMALFISILRADLSRDRAIPQCPNFAKITQ